MFLAGLTAARRRCYHEFAGWSSLVARWAHNPKVGGSNPPPATILKAVPNGAAFLVYVARSGKPYSVYVLWSQSGRCFYIGISEDPEHRRQQHNAAENRGWPARHRPWELVYRGEVRRLQDGPLPGRVAHSSGSCSSGALCGIRLSRCPGDGSAFNNPGRAIL